MLFHVTQSHSPDDCPIDAGGSSVLYNSKADGVKLRAMYGAFSEHVVYYIVEADSIGPVHQFLIPGFKRCTCTITPVSEEPIIQ